MDEPQIIYIAIPFSQDKCCPRCTTQSTGKRIATIKIRRHDSKTVMFPLHYCRVCGIGFADITMRKQFRKSYPRSDVPFIKLNESSTATTIRRLCFGQTTGEESLLQNNESQAKHPTRPVNNIVKSNSEMAHFSSFKPKPSRQLLTNPLDYFSSLIPDDFFNYVITLLEHNLRYVLALFLSIHKRTYAFIISDYNDEKDGSIFILDYHSNETRRILAEVLLLCEKKIQFREKEYRYLDRTILKNGLFSCPNSIHIGKIREKKNAGYQSRKYKLIDTLLYSPKTKRYEILKGSYDAANETLFFDPAQYLDYLVEYGNPNIILLPLKDNTNDNDDYDWFYLRKEWSIYSMFGYNVNKNSNMSSYDRQKILARLIDSGLTTVEETISFLKGVIRDHKGEKYHIAHEKWLDDLEFIKNYRTESDGFAVL